MAKESSGPPAPTFSPCLIETDAYNRLLGLAVEMGAALSDCGAEIFRIEETVGRVIEAYVGRRADVFAVVTFLSVSLTDASGASYSRSIRLRGRNQDLDRLDKLNALARDICAQPLTLDDFSARLDAILAMPTHPYWFKTLAGSLSGAAFACLLGCPLPQALWALLIGAAMYLCIHPLRRLEINQMVINLIGSAVITALALLLQWLALIAPDQTGLITIGAMMNLVPGLTLTNGIRDLIASDYVAGLSNLTEAILMAAGMGIGSGAVLALARFL